MRTYEWDEAKRFRNVEKHGLDFIDAQEFEWDDAILVADKRQEYGEDRFIAFGLLRGRLMALTFTPRLGVTRLISLRRANEREVRWYESRIND